MRANRQRIAAAVALLALGLSIGLQVLILQGIAWACMFSEYKENTTYSHAIELTFSGDEICGLCIAADEIQADINETYYSYHHSNNHLLLLPTTEKPILSNPAPQRKQYHRPGSSKLTGEPPKAEIPPPRSHRA